MRSDRSPMNDGGWTARAVPGITGHCQTVRDIAGRGTMGQELRVDDTTTRAKLPSPSSLTASIGERLIFPSTIMSD